MKRFLAVLFTLVVFFGCYFVTNADDEKIYGVNVPVTIINNTDLDVVVTFENIPTLDEETYVLKPGETLELNKMQPNCFDGFVFDHYNIFSDNGAFPLKEEQSVAGNVKIGAAYYKNKN